MMGPSNISVFETEKCWCFLESRIASGFFFGFLGSVSLDPLGRPVLLLFRMISWRGSVACVQVRRFQMSRTVLSFMPYLLATEDAFITSVALSCKGLTVNISMACCSVRIARRSFRSSYFWDILMSIIEPVTSQARLHYHRRRTISVTFVLRRLLHRRRAGEPGQKVFFPESERTGPAAGRCGPPVRRASTRRASGDGARCKNLNDRDSTTDSPSRLRYCQCWQGHWRDRPRLPVHAEHMLERAGKPT
jgi:hypothetical protein